eukprot:Pgem_evm1s2979
MLSLTFLYSLTEAAHTNQHCTRYDATEINNALNTFVGIDADGDTFKHLGFKLYNFVRTESKSYGKYPHGAFRQTEIVEANSNNDDGFIKYNDVKHYTLYAPPSKDYDLNYCNFNVTRNYQYDEANCQIVYTQSHPGCQEKEETAKKMYDSVYRINVNNFVNTIAKKK